MLDIQDSVSHSVWLIKLMNLLKVDTHTSPPHRSCWTSTLLSEIKKVDTNTLSGYEYIAHVSYLSMGIHVYIYIYIYFQGYHPMFPTWPGARSDSGQSISRAALPWQRSLEQVEVIGRSLGALGPTGSVDGQGPCSPEPWESWFRIGKLSP